MQRIACPLGRALPAAAWVARNDRPNRPEGEARIMKLREMDDQVTYAQQLQDDGGPVGLINQFTLAPADAGRFLQVWADGAAFMKQQPGFISAQLHRGIAGSTTFINVAVWESAAALGRAFGLAGVPGP